MQQRVIRINIVDAMCWGQEMPSVWHVCMCVLIMCVFLLFLLLLEERKFRGNVLPQQKRKNSFPSFFLPLPHSGSEEKFGNGFVHSAMCSNLPTRSLTVHQYPFVGFAQICDRGDSQPRQSIVGICTHLRSTRTVDGGHL